MADELLRIEADFRESIEADFPEELQACRAQLEYARANAVPWGGRKPEMPQAGSVSADNILLLEFGRSTKSYWSSVLLAASGFAEQSMMVNRSLFEGMVVAHWVSENPETAEERFVDALKYETHEAALIYRDLGWWSEEEMAPFVLSDDAVEALAKKYGRGLWTAPSGMDNLVDSIEHLWKTVESRLEFRNFYRVAYRDANKILHADPTGIAGSLRAFTTDVFSVVSGPESKDVLKSMYVAFRTYSELISLIFDHFDFGLQDEYASLFSDWLGSFYKLRPDLAKGRARNQLCPCGSGRKIKHCHGR